MDMTDTHLSFLSIPQLHSMHTQIRSISLALIIVTVTTLAWKLLNWLWFRPKRLERILRNQGLNGNPYRVLYGDLKEIGSMMKQSNLEPISLSDDIVPRVLPFMQQTIQNYGKNTFTWFGPKPRVYIMDPDLVKEVFTKMNDYPKPYGNALVRYIACGIVSYEGNKWVKHRKIINPAFHLEKLKLMVPAFYQSSIEMVNKWEELVPDEGSCELDVWPYLQTMSSDAISRTAFGSSFEEGKRIFQLLNQLSLIIRQLLVSLYIPGWRFLPTKTNRRLKQLDKEIEASLMTIIEKRQRSIKAGESTNDDLLGVLMESNFREKHGNGDDARMSVKEMMDECRLFYFAGQETTSVLLVWTMILLSKHQDWQTRAREEVLQVFGDRKPDFDGLGHLKVVSMVLYEVLRLYPPVVALAREVHKEQKLGKYVLPDGVQLSLPPLLIHRDKELWGDDALEFNPERFLEGVSKATKNQVSFLPFGWGPRICIGQNFGLMEAKMALVVMLRNFSFEISPSYRHSPRMVITLQPEHGAPVILHRLKRKLAV